MRSIMASDTVPSSAVPIRSYQPRGSNCVQNIMDPPLVRASTIRRKEAALAEAAALLVLRKKAQAILGDPEDE